MDRTPQERRRQGIAILVKKLIGDKGTVLTEDRAEIARMIGELAPLGRTNTWKGGVAYWQLMVQDQDNPLYWAILQGSIYCAFDA